MAVNHYIGRVHYSITWLDTNGFTITFLCQLQWSTAMVIDSHWTVPETNSLSECFPAKLAPEIFGLYGSIIDRQPILGSGAT